VSFVPHSDDTLFNPDLDDVELETALQIRSHDLSWSSIHTDTLEEPPSLSPTLKSRHADHGFTSDKRNACCGMNSSGLVDCQACLGGEIERLSEYLDEGEKACTLEMVSQLNDAGPRGIGRKSLIVSFSAYPQLTKVLMPSDSYRLAYKHWGTQTCAV
jgi:hypothetical protein